MHPYRGRAATSQRITKTAQSLILNNPHFYSLTGSINRIYGRGPKTLPVSQIEEFYKYESSSRTFRVLPSRALTGTTDAISVDPNKMKKLLLTSNN